MTGSGTAPEREGRHRLGPYLIHEKIGEGGMGEVYRATDTRLDRTVAIKILPSHVAQRPEHLQRFEREARVISSLSHPHICVLHDVGDQDGKHFLVMELVEGETLERRLSRGRLPLRTALEYAVQIADALESAHRRSVIHRDLKPSNIMLTRSGVKLLDFGLAKLLPVGVTGRGPSDATTEAAGDDITREGTILGTLQYLAPEQLEGKDSDQRTDIFVLGMIVYEMVSGQRAFRGDSQASLISAIMTADPRPVTAFAPEAPPSLQHFVRTSLEKDPDHRWQTAHDAKVQLKWVASGESEPLGEEGGLLVERIVTSELRARTSRILWRVGTAAFLLALVAGVTGWLLRGAPEPIRGQFVLSGVPSRSISVSGTSTMIDISPDASTVVYSTEEDGQPYLFQRPVEEPEGRLLPVGLADTPFISTDGQWIGFNSLEDGALRRISRDGNAAEPITPVNGTVRGASWGSQNNIVFATSESTGLLEVNWLGGEVQPLTQPVNREEDHFFPFVLPNGRDVLFTIRRGEGIENSAVAVFDRDEKMFRELVPRASHARYGNGYLTFAREGVILAAAFDLNTLRLEDDSVIVLEGVVPSVTGAVPYSYARDGTLVWAGGEVADAERTLAFADPITGELDLIDVDPRPYLHPRISPDQSKVVVQVDPVDDDGQAQVFTLDLDADDLLVRQFSTEGGSNIRPVWRGNSQVTYASDRSGLWAIYSQPVDQFGAGPPLYMAEAGVELWPESWSPDGNTLVFVRVEGESRGLWTLTLSGDGSVRAEIFVDDTEFQETGAIFDPSGSRVAFYTDRTGYNVWLKEVGSDVEPIQITTNGGVFPLWSPDGGELMFRRPQGATAPGGTGLIAVQVFSSGSAGISDERLLPIRDFTVIPTHRDYDMTASGRPLMVFPVERTTPGGREQVHAYIRYDWFETLRSRVPGR